MSTDNCDLSLGVALMRICDRIYVREKITDIFTEKCKIIFDKIITITNANIEKLEEDTSEHHCRISQLKKMVDDTEQDRRETNLILK